MSVGIVSVSSFTEHPKHIYALMGQCANVTSNCPFLLLIRCIGNFYLEINFLIQIVSQGIPMYGI